MLRQIVAIVLSAPFVQSLVFDADDQSEAWLQHTGSALADSEDDMMNLLGVSSGLLNAAHDNERSPPTEHLTEEEEFIYKPELPVAPGSEGQSTLNRAGASVGTYVPKLVDAN